MIVTSNETSVPAHVINLQIPMGRTTAVYATGYLLRISLYSRKKGEFDLHQHMLGKSNSDIILSTARLCGPGRLASAKVEADCPAADDEIAAEGKENRGIEN